MGRPKLPSAERRVKVTVTMTPEVLAWVDDHCGVGGRFRDRTHAVEHALVRLMRGTEEP